MTEAEKINTAIGIAVQYGGIDGEHHKTWVIDQMVRIFAGDQYDTIVAVRARVAPPRICLSCLRADFPNWEAVERRDTASPPADPAADRDGGGGT